MKLELKELRSNKFCNKDLEFTLDIKDMESLRDQCSVIEPIIFRGKVKSEAEAVYLMGNVSAKLELGCARCTQGVPCGVDITIEDKFTNSIEDDSEEAIYLNSEIVDISQVIGDHIFFELPLNILCHDDCKGLCQVCGTDLNLNNCDCDCLDEDIDLRFEQLKDFFVKK